MNTFREPLCSAPFRGILVDTNKKVFPCVAWADAYIGDLNTDKLSDILKNPVLEETRNLLSAHEWPHACRTCKNREEQTGNSTRLDTYVNIKTQHSSKLAHIEYNSSNMCNLICIGCGPFHSSSWVHFTEETEIKNRSESNSQRWQIYPATKELIGQFEDIDLSELESLWFKGGEPFLNKENVSLLEHLDSIGVLKNITIDIMTNGTVYNHNFQTLLSKSKKVRMHISIDGVGDHNVWVRAGYETESVSHTDNIKENIKKYLLLENLAHIGNTYTIHALNVSRVTDFEVWWENEIMVMDKRIHASIFDQFILWPEHLSARVLSDSFRSKLADTYESLDRRWAYKHVIDFLRLPYHNPFNDHHHHNRLVEYVGQLNRHRSKTIQSIVPELIPELLDFV